MVLAAAPDSGLIPGGYPALLTSPVPNADPADLAWALRALRARQADYRLTRAYYDGNHRLAFASAKYASTFGRLFQAFADNLCPAVIDAVADRLQVTGFDFEGGARDKAEGTPPEEKAEDARTAAAWALWQQNRMARRSGEVHQEALRCGDAYVMVWPDADGVPRFYPQPALAMTVHYDPEQPDRIDRAAKAWQAEDGKLRLTIYYADRIEKWVTSNKADGLPDSPRSFIPFEPADGSGAVLPHEYGQVPVFHFANNGPMGGFGRSELADVIPLQDALNKSIADMLVAMEFVALPQRWATGLQPEIDPETQQPRFPFQPGVDRLWGTSDANVKFGEFRAADLTQFREVAQDFRLEVARVSRTPLHYLMLQAGGFPSGESLKTAESPFITKLEDRMLAFGDVWSDAMSLALRMQGMANPGQLQTMWQPASPRDEYGQARIAVIKQGLKIPESQIWSELGYTPEQIAEFEAENAAHAPTMPVEQEASAAGEKWAVPPAASTPIAPAAGTAPQTKPLQGG